jgi:hypothetical protein
LRTLAIESGLHGVGHALRLGDDGKAEELGEIESHPFE